MPNEYLLSRHTSLYNIQTRFRILEISSFCNLSTIYIARRTEEDAAAAREMFA